MVIGKELPGFIADFFEEINKRIRAHSPGNGLSKAQKYWLAFCVLATLATNSDRKLTCIPLSDVVGNVNRSLRGWANYFHFRSSSKVMSKARQHAEDRLRVHLMKRHKVRDRKAALCRFPRRDLYERYGLYKVSGRAGWSSAHASV